jgi:hypothetical protein
MWKARNQILHFVFPNHAAFHDGALLGFDVIKVLRAETFLRVGDHVIPAMQLYS